MKGRNALLTGGAAGIGRTVSLALGAQGANVVVADLDLEAARRTATEVEQLGVRSVASRVDVADVERHRAWVARLEGDFGPIGILVNNAGVTSSSRLLELTPAEWDIIEGVNCRGNFFLTQAIYERMLSRRHGRIIRAPGHPGRSQGPCP